MAEAMLRARLAEIAPDTLVGSAGLLFDGRPAEPTAVSVMAQRGLDLSGHAAQRISAPLLDSTSLILGMERRHVREVGALGPDLFARSFTLLEVVSLGRVVGPRPPGQDLRSWATLVGSSRSAADYVYPDPSAEIDDPMGGSAREFRDCADLIDSQLEALVGLAWPTPQPRDPLVAPAPSGGIHADRDRR